MGDKSEPRTRRFKTSYPSFRQFHEGTFYTPTFHRTFREYHLGYNPNFAVELLRAFCYSELRTSVIHDFHRFTTQSAYWYFLGLSAAPPASADLTKIRHLLFTNAFYCADRSHTVFTYI